MFAYAKKTITEMPEPTHVLLAPMAVYLLLRIQQLPPRLLIVHAQPTPTEKMRVSDAPLVRMEVPTMEGLTLLLLTVYV